MSSADDLRAIYQENAAMFLAACVKQKIHPDENKLDDASASSGTATSNASSLCKQMFDPLAVANALRIRSIYDTDVTAPGIDSKCIVSNTRTEKSEVVNLIRSGGDEVLASAEVGDTEAAISMKIYETQKSLLQIQKDAGMNIAAATIQLAESIADNMLTNISANQKMLRHDFYCKGCGNPLLPSPLSLDENGLQSSKIRLKSIKRGKARKRRASRQAAKKYTYDTNILQKHKGGGRSFAQGKTNGHGNAVASVMSTQEALKKNNAIRRIGDGISKNCISYKCCCGTVQCIKGMKRQRQSQMNQSVAYINTNQSPRAKLIKYSQEANRFSDSEDFLRLGKVPLVAAPPRSTEKKLKLLEQLQSKKRKPKAKTLMKKKSGLQNFLSSLND